MVATTAKTVIVSTCSGYWGTLRTDETLDLTSKLHCVVKDNRDDTGVDEYEEDKPEKLPPSPAVFESERQLWEELWMFLVVVLKRACASLELSLCRSATIVVYICLWPICWSVCRSPCKPLLSRTLPAIPTATAVYLLQRLFVVWAEVDSSSGYLIAVAGAAPDHVHAGTASTYHLGHVESGGSVTLGS